MPSIKTTTYFHNVHVYDVYVDGVYLTTCGSYAKAVQLCERIA